MRRSADGRDYLDWFEITRARAASGEFADYLRLKEDLRRRMTMGDPVSSIWTGCRRRRLRAVGAWSIGSCSFARGSFVTAR